MGVWRWQTVPLLVIIVVFTATLSVRAVKLRGASWREFWLWNLLSVVALVPLYVFPLPRFAPPTGPFHVGTESVELQVSTREDSTRLRARIWYPAQRFTSGNDRRWLERPDRMLDAWSAASGLPKWTLSHLVHVEGHADWGAIPLDGTPRAPVVTFTHGQSGWAARNTFLLRSWPATVR